VCGFQAKRVKLGSSRNSVLGSATPPPPQRAWVGAVTGRAWLGFQDW
jgi:hypothetical protein